LKSFRAYTFRFVGFDSKGDMVDEMSQPYSFTTTHSFSIEFLWNYLALAAFELKDVR
jgi:hypothetical protein